MSGILLHKGMTAVVPEGGFSLRIADDGSVVGHLELHLKFDVCPTWIGLALAHRDRAREMQAGCVRAFQVDDGESQAGCLELEYESSMQAIVACAVAFDGLYANLVDVVGIPPELRNAWRTRTRRTARFRQVAEVIRRGFYLKQEKAIQLRECLKGIYDLRDRAVHPSSAPAAPKLRSDIGVGVDWRFADYCFTTANPIVDFTARSFWSLVNRETFANDRVAAYANSLKERIQRFFPPS